MDWSVLWQFRAALWSGLLVTLWVSALGIFGSTILGVTLGCLGTLPSLLLRRLIAVYAELMRNLPLVVKLFFLHFIAGIPAAASAVAALSLHHGAYVADITRAGFRAVAPGQLEAGLSLGLRRHQCLRRIILPQMVPVLAPPMTTQYVSVLKNSSVVALIALEDLTFQTQEINVQTFRGFEAATAATLLYGLVALAMIGTMRLLPRQKPVR